MILSKKRITKALIRLRGCAGWSAPVLFASPRRQVFSRRGPYSIVKSPVKHGRLIGIMSLSASSSSAAAADPSSALSHFWCQIDNF